MRSPFAKAALAVLVTLVVVFGIAALVVLEYKKEQRQLADFKEDVLVSGFQLAKMEKGADNPRKINEEDGVVYEILVSVNGCTMELERKKDEKAQATTRSDTTRGARIIEVYVLDEAVGRGGAELEIENGPPTPIADEVAAYLKQNSKRFEYCLTA